MVKVCDTFYDEKWRLYRRWGWVAQPRIKQAKPQNAARFKGRGLLRIMCQPAAAFKATRDASEKHPTFHGP